jgi:SPP1 gp7 family putative phage head morphogenesis protein
MCKNCTYIYNLSEDYLDGLPPIFKKAMQDLHAGIITPGSLSPELVEAIAKELWSGIKIGISSSELNSLDTSIAAIMKDNVYVFSGFKTYQQLQEATLLMHDENGEIKPFTQFYKDVQGLNKTYNETYLEAEYNHAVASGQMASNWENIQERKDVGKFLKYKTAEDDRVRPAHAAIDNVILPVDHPFWNTYYPPNGWMCRCHVIQIVDGPASVDFDSPEIPKMFQNNIGKTGIVFPETHPYYDVNKKAKAEILKSTNNIITNNQ